MSAAPWDALAGQYHLRPGQHPGVVGERPVLSGGRLGSLLRGQSGEEVSRTLGSVFTLCAHAHRRAAALALAAAQTQAHAMAASAPPVLLWIETARDHLRSIALEWPQRLPDAPRGAQWLDWLRGCPLPLAATRPMDDVGAASQTLGALRAWLEQRVLEQPAALWLSNHCEPDALAHWCRARSEGLLPARCLAAWNPVAHKLRPEIRRLDLLDEDLTLQSGQLRELAAALAKQPDFAQRPTWQGQCAETGPWARLRHRHDPLPQHSAWTRLSARWIELIELAAADPSLDGGSHAPLLSSGALSLGDGAALAWCEMARGLLLHWVQLDSAGCVQDYQIVAPTEWNFHPDGGLSRVVAILSPGDAATAQMLAAAYDPCVACTVQT